MNQHIKLGNFGEKQAARYLRTRNYKILQQNYRCRYGEIDIIAKDTENTLVFIEVKTRSSEKYGRGMESVTSKKQQRLKKTSLYFLQKNKIFFEGLRFDVIDILKKQGKPPKILHIKNAF